jgi:hypothetical protein
MVFNRYIQVILKRSLETQNLINNTMQSNYIFRDYFSKQSIHLYTLPDLARVEGIPIGKLKLNIKVI